MVLGPLYKLIDNGEQGMRPFGETIFNPRRDLGKNPPLDEAIRLESAQRRDQHFLRNVAQLRRKVFKTQRLVTVKGIEHQNCRRHGHTVCETRRAPH